MATQLEVAVPPLEQDENETYKPASVSNRVREILDSMREQRESFLASIHPTEAEAAAKKLILLDNPPPPPPPSTTSSSTERPPLFSPIEAEKITKRLNDSIRQRKERLAKFSTSSDYKYRSARTTGASDYSFRKSSGSPLSVTTASTEENTFFSGSTPHDTGYDSDHSTPQLEIPLHQYPNLDEIEEANHESESEKESCDGKGAASTSAKAAGKSLRNSHKNKKESSLVKEELEEEDDHSDLSASDTERTESSSKRMGAPMMTLFGYTSFENEARPPLLVTCTSNSSMRGIDANDQKYIEKPAPAKRAATSETVVSGLSNYSDSIRVGPLGPTVEERKRQLLKTLNSTVQALSELDVDVEEEISSVASIQHYLRDRSDSSSVTDIGISSASSFSFSTTNGSDTSGWESPGGSKSNSLVASSEEDSLAEKSITLDLTDRRLSPLDLNHDPLERRPSLLDTSCHNSTSSSSYDFENPLGVLPIEEPEGEIKVLFTPPEPQQRKRISPQGKEEENSKRSVTSKSKNSKCPPKPNRVSFHQRISVRLRTPDPEELEEIMFPRGNLWNIAKSTGLSFEGPIKIKGKPVHRSADYIRYSAEYRCAARGGLMDLALASGMAKTQIAPLKTQKVPPVNGKRRWKLKARGGSYHMAVWTRLSNNVQSPSSIFRPRQDSPPTEERPPSTSWASSMPEEKEETLSELAEYADKLRRCKRNCGAKGSFFFVCNESRKEAV
eukprot:CAMPEP_0172458072 /NCGR_PEP_ID=MMETSP1065-20121228/25657_1 /TAXON_ID=265537 /ORGANISM="Amphiprora paludosa, Strain CCMP125" /LENGTH=727 /DNA_ID=CAMNT_0013212141 /DNA_START=213 /DNA_END=2396 /DNA_ORIENTATION=+